ncbi:MAG: serpin family protein [Eubacterium sp.]|nr:serpin family protein [Eubacterium sp.]
MKLKRKITALCVLGAVVLSSACSSSGSGISYSEGDLTKNVAPHGADTLPPDYDFISSQFDLSLKLFKETVKQSDEPNVMISPLSVQLALAMTANGADGQTKDEMMSLLAAGIDPDSLNSYLKGYTDTLPSGDKNKLNIANSIWIKGSDTINVSEQFLQTNVDYYNAKAYKLPFDDDALNMINAWAADNTDGMIKKIVDEFDGTEIMYLINAICFDAEWEEQYKDTDVIENQTFYNYDGSESKADLMYSVEGAYFSCVHATGFIKNYKDNKYGFVGILPNNDIDINEYIAELKVGGLQDILYELNSLDIGHSVIMDSEDDAVNVNNSEVEVYLPKFTSEYGTEMKNILSALGMPTAFDSGKADFSQMGDIMSDGNAYIGSVLHKTYISVDEKGTKASAVTSVEINNEAAVIAPERPIIRLDRPFIYMIIDNDTNLPLFIGTVKNM